MEKLKIGIIGLGARGYSLLESVLLEFDEIEIAAVCDIYADRTAAADELIEKSGRQSPICETDYKKLLSNPAIDAVIIITSWETHVEIATAAMHAGKAVAMEVGGAYSIKECWTLVETWEKTKTPFMFLENCCFGRREMMILNMAELGYFGEIVHCEGGYCHDLRHEVAFGYENRHYRLDNYIRRNCENYPTHDLGPIAKVLKINEGNRLLSLTSTASKSAGMHDFIKKNKSDDTALLNTHFMQGDIVTTVIKTYRGETITLTLDTTLPRYYSRRFTVRGTNAMYEEVTDSIFTDCKEDIAHDFTWRQNKIGDAAKFEEKYDHPVWKKYLNDGVCGTHDGMDYLEFKTFFNALAENKPMPINVYDAALWMSISVLSEQSIAAGSTPVSIPDFTRGKWLKSNT